MRAQALPQANHWVNSRTACRYTLLTVAMGLCFDKFYILLVPGSANLCPIFSVNAALLVSLASRTSEAAPYVHYTVPRPRGCGLLGGCAMD